MNIQEAKRRAEELDETTPCNKRIWIQEHRKTGVCSVHTGVGKAAMKKAYKAGFRVHEALREHGR